MRHLGLGVRSIGIYRCVAGRLVSALLLALFLSFAPEVHQPVHADANNSAHQCAATLFASGSCLHTDETLVKLDFQLPPTPLSASCRLSPRTVRAKMSILEHAPPPLPIG